MPTTIVENSVMSLHIQMRFEGQPLSTGTAFVANMKQGPVLVTNRHNLTGRHQETDQPLSKNGGVPNQVVILHNRANHLGHWMPTVELLYEGDQPRWIEHAKLGAKADFVALPLKNLDQVQLYPYDPSNPGTLIKIGPAEVVSVIGFPFGLGVAGSLAVWATGFVASEPEIDFGGLPTFLIDCRSRPGQSGSAVVAYRSGGAVALENGNTGMYSGAVHRFLGIYSGRINAESDLGIVWKAAAVAELLGQGG